MVKILITGVDGYIGSKVAVAFASSPDQKYHVFGLSRRGVPHPNPLPEGEGVNPSPQPSPRGRGDVTTINGDFTDKNQMMSVLSDIQPDVIIHCAGLTPHASHQVQDYARVNFEGGKNLIEAIRSFPSPQPSPRGRGRSPKFINCSTIGVYGVPDNDNGVVSPSDFCSPASPYAQSKYDFENYLSAQDDIAYLNFRIANIPGRDAFINYVLGGGEVTFHGDDPYIRDYIHLDDLSDLFIKGVEYLMNGGESTTLNAGSGVGYSFPDIVTEIESQMGQSITRHQGPTKTGDVVRIICDISDTKQRLGWAPRHTNLDQIIRYAIDNRSL